MRVKIVNLMGWNVNNRWTGLVACPPKFVPFPEPQNFINRVLADIIKWRGGHTRVGWAVNPIWPVFLKEEKEHRDRHTGRRLCDEVGRHRSDASIRQGMPVLLLAIPEAKRTWNRFSPRAFRKNMILSTLWFWTLSLRNYKRIKSYCLKPPSLWKSVTTITGS